MVWVSKNAAPLLQLSVPGLPGEALPYELFGAAEAAEAHSILLGQLGQLRWLPPACVGDVPDSTAGAIMKSGLTGGHEGRDDDLMGCHAG